MFMHDSVDNVVNRRNVTGPLLTSLQIFHELLGGQSLRFGERRPKYRRDNYFVGGTEGACEIVLEDSTAGRRRPRLEHRPNPAIRIAAPQCRKRFMHGGRMMSKVVHHGDV